MKRKFLAALLALVMVFSMIPVSASAEEAIKVTGDTPLQTPGLSVTFKIHTTQLYKLLMNEAEIDSLDPDEIKIKDVYLLLDEEHYLGGEHHFSNVGFTLAETDYLSLVMQENDLTLQPDNIRGLRISYTSHGSSKSIELTPGDLWLECKVIPGNSATEYTVKSSNESKAIVAFYDNGESGQETAYSLYQVYLVDRNSMLGESKWPKNPDYIGYTFIGWGTDKKGGSAPFLPTSTVSEDTEVFSQKVTSEVSGTEIRVINENNALKKRFVELYNAEHQTSLNIDSSSINWNSMKISVHGNDGKSTNPNYNNLIDKNEWKDNDNYYRIVNYDADIWGLDQYINHHVAPQNITGMTVWVEVNGVSSPVDISRGTAEGSFEVSMQSDVIAKLYIKAAPTPPSSDELENPDDNTIFPAGAVTIDCTNEQADHTDKTYSLIAGTYTVSKSATWVSDGEGSGYYTAEVTIDFDQVGQYVSQYATEYVDVTHTLVPEQGDKTITLIWQNGKWVTADGSAPVTYNVACDTEPEDETPEKPNDTWIANNIEVNVNCVEEKHDPKQYNLEKYTSTDVEKDDEGYFFTITIDANDYVAKYINDVESYHLLDSDESLTVTVRYTEKDANDGYWVANPSSVTINVKCDSGTTDPEKPDGDTIIGLLGNEAVLVQCDVADSGHARRYYPLLSGTFTIGDVENNTVKVTVDSNEYLKEYTLYSGKEHSEVIAQDENYFTLTWSGSEWTVSGAPVTFTVHCSTSEEPEKPAAPDVVKLLGTNAVEVLCVTNVHGSKTYGLLNGGYMEQGPDWITGQGEVDGYWQYVVTIDAGVYQAQFNTDTKSKHDLASPAETYLPITLIYRDNTWVIEGTEPYTTIKLVCDSEEPTLPEKPDDETIYNIFNGNKPVVLACVTENSGHEEQAFDLIPGSYEIGEVKEIGGRYLCDITIVNVQDYIDIYNENTDKEHSLSPNQPNQVLTLKYADGEWAIDDDGMVFYKVACEDTSTEPTPDPNPTPDPTPTPGPGGGDNPPYIPPVDPDDSGVSDLLNTDDHIQYLFGYPEGTFGPENNMTRAEVAQMFYNLLLDQDVTITKTFDDVPANAWYAKAVNTLASLGVVSGVGNGDFEPERSITRAEFTSIAMKFAEGKTGGTNIFSDVKSTDWFYRAVVNSTQYGWIHGYGDGTFRPNNPITRVEVTAIVNNMLGREADVDFVTEHYDELNHFSDLAVSHWGYYHIVEATNDHDYTKPSSGENWTELN